jgi:DNA repair exonuclease SbcCD ATPase subunit
MKNFSFPILKKVQIKYFSLYKKAEFLDIDLDKNVFCLAGANGLGKSTFITIINYALTGIVKKPNTNFSWYKSIPAFYNKSKSFVEDYFDGRINEEDFDRAEVTLLFTIEEHEYSITRGFFEPDELRKFSKKTNGNEIKISDELSYSELNDEFKTHFTKDVSLADFDQFVFLQFYVLTFDETHQLLFWDENLIERVLYLFFGVDAKKAKQADQLRKDYNKHGSDARNIQWRITQTRNELKTLSKSLQNLDLNNTSNLEAYEVHKSLLEKSDELNDKLQRIAEEIKDADLNIANLSLKASSLRSEYSNVFTLTLNEDTPIEKNSRVIEILNDLKLRIYASKDFADLIEKLVEIIKEQQKTLTGKNAQQYFEQLRKIDEQLLEVSNKIEDFQVRKDRLIQNENDYTLQLNETNSQIDEYEKENEELVRSIHKLKNNSSIDAIINGYKEQIERYAGQKAEAYEKRDKARKELEPLEAELNVGYIDAEEEFIPIFNQYAKSFLGLDLNINLATSSKGISLSIDIDETKRRDSFQLSESQRYFVDIALRMALIDLNTKSATMLIDTPEGSLDIAYENRAGKMFADFVNNFRKIIMTANINSSQLLLELAHICKSDGMRIERMTDWTLLSEVQQQENNRIEEAYANLEAKLTE